MSWKLDIFEKKVITIAISIAVGSLVLMSYAALKLGIGVPTCRSDLKPFTKGEVIKKGDHKYEVHVLAKMWSFEPQKITLPKNSDVTFFIASADVQHGFYLEGTNINLMAVPGAVNVASREFKDPGIFHITCHEFCGSGHQNMNGIIEILSTENDQDPNITSNGIAGGQLAGENKRDLLQEKGCVACHTTDGTPRVGPTFKGLFGSKETLDDGRVVIVDEAYIRSHILEPEKQTVKGFPKVMPKLPINNDELDLLVQQLKELK